MMKLRRGFLLSALALGIAVVNAGCTSTPTAGPACPAILIPVDTANLTRFKPGPGRDIIDVLHEETITGFGHRCTYDTDETGAGNVVVEVAPMIESNLGPTNATRVADFEYFLAVTDQDKTILDKARFPVSVTFPGNLSRVQWQRENAVVMRIPLESGQTGEDFTVFLGLQLTRDELEYQRRTKK